MTDESSISTMLCQLCLLLEVFCGCALLGVDVANADCCNVCGCE